MITLIIDAGCVTLQSTALQAAIAASKFGEGGEASSSVTVAPQWRKWVAVRDACHLGKAWRYCDDQIQFHYAHGGKTWLRTVLERWPAMAAAIVSSATPSPSVTLSSSSTTTSSSTASSPAVVAVSATAPTSSSTITSHDNQIGERKSRGDPTRNQMSFDMHLLADHPEYVKQAAALVRYISTHLCWLL
jgi:hypothetical protein